MSIVSKLAILIESNSWQKHGNVIKTILQTYKCEPLDAHSRGLIESVIAEVYGDAICVNWDLRPGSHDQSAMICKGAPLADRTIFFLI